MKKHFFLAALAVVAVSCGGNKQQNVASVEEVEMAEVQEETVSTKPIEDLNGVWYVAKVEEAEVAPIDSSVYVEFVIAENRISAFAGCNNISAELAQRNRSVGSLQLENSAMTQKLCEDTPWEMPLAKALNDVRRYEFRGETLLLLNEDGAAVVELQK